MSLNGVVQCARDDRSTERTISIVISNQGISKQNKDSWSSPESPFVAGVVVLIADILFCE